jgi:hypothetical protein
MTDHLDVAEFESSHQSLKLIRTIGNGPWKIELYLDTISDHYYAKGPFARWDAVCYVFLDKVRSQEDVDLWITQLEGSS